MRCDHCHRRFKAADLVVPVLRIHESTDGLVPAYQPENFIHLHHLTLEEIR